MAQRKQLTWSELRVGLFVLVGLLILAVGIFYVTGAGVFGPKYRLKTYLPEVSGLSTGAPVRLDGVEIGNVDRIPLVPRETGKTARPHAQHRSRDAHRPQYQKDILTDSAASLVTEGLLGNRYVNIQRGYTGVPLERRPSGARRSRKKPSRKSSSAAPTCSPISKPSVTESKTSSRACSRARARSENCSQTIRPTTTSTASSAKAIRSSATVQSGQGTLGKLFMNDEMAQQG